jgi:dolichol-phosphate mannosyltransferase|tara:strand:- start:385 stop:1101 length:717 start_codon:yes stop_codon:yes gene_type:complete
MNKMLKKKITIIIPVFNEKKYINEIISRIKKNISFEKQIIIVDDYSSDGTRKIIKQIKNIDKIIFHKRNLGKGAAIKSAIPYIKGNIVAIQDADLEYNPVDLNKLIKIMISKDIKIIYGSRVLKKKRYNNNLFISNFRTFGNHVLTIISNLLNNQKLTDAHTCYKIFTNDIFIKLDLQENDFAFCPEVTTKISLLNEQIKEVPISFKGRTVSEGKKIQFYDAVRALITILKYRYFVKF